MNDQNIVKRTDIFLVPFSKMQILPGFNLPGREDGIEELAESLYQNGPKVPMKGYKDGDNYIVVAGHRRLAAAQLVKSKYKKSIIFPFITYPRGTSHQEMILDHFLTNDGIALTPLQKAVGVSQLMAEGMKPKEIAQKLGVSEVYIGNLKKLADAPKEAQDLVRKGVISSTLLIQVLKKNTGDITEFIKEAIAKAEELDTADKTKAAEKDATQKKRLEKRKSKSKGETVAKDRGTKAPGQKKTARVTNKNIKQNSLRELKRFIKITRNDMPFIRADREATYNFCRDLMDNKLTYDQVNDFFTNTKDK